MSLAFLLLMLICVWNNVVPDFGQIFDPAKLIIIIVFWKLTKNLVKLNWGFLGLLRDIEMFCVIPVQNLLGHPVSAIYLYFDLQILNYNIM